MVDVGLIAGIFFLLLRILLVGTERIFLTKNKLGKYNSILLTSLFFLVASFLLLPGLLLVPEDAYLPQNLKPILFVVFSSLFYAVGFYSYVKALSVEEASLIAPLYNSSLIWLLILSSIFLQDSLTVTRIGGGIIIFVGVFFLYSGSLREKYSAIINSKGSLIMIAGSVFLAIGRTIDAYAISNANTVLYAIAMNFLVGVYLLVISVLKGYSKDIKTVLTRDWRNLLGAAICNGWAYLFLLIAIIYLQVTVAEPASLLSLFVTAYLAKKFLGENVKERIPGIIIILLGSFLLFFDKF